MPRHSVRSPPSPTPSDLSIASSYWDQFFPSDDAVPSNTRTLSHRPSSPTLGQSPKVTIRPEPKPLSSYAVTDSRWEADSQDLHHSVSAEQVARLRRVPKEGKGLDDDGKSRMRVLKRSDHVPSRREWPVERRREGAGGREGVREGRVGSESVTLPRVDSANDMSRDSAAKAGRAEKVRAPAKVRVQVLPDTASDRRPPRSESVMVAESKDKSGNARMENPKNVTSSRAGPAGQSQAMHVVRVKVIVPETLSSEKPRLRRRRARGDLSASGVSSRK